MVEEGGGGGGGGEGGGGGGRREFDRGAIVRYFFSSFLSLSLLDTRCWLFFSDQLEETGVPALSHSQEAKRDRRRRGCQNKPRYYGFEVSRTTNPPSRKVARATKPLRSSGLKTCSFSISSSPSAFSFSRLPTSLPAPTSAQPPGRAASCSREKREQEQREENADHYGERGAASRGRCRRRVLLCRRLGAQAHQRARRRAQAPEHVSAVFFAGQAVSESGEREEGEREFGAVFQKKKSIRGTTRQILDLDASHPSSSSPRRPCKTAPPHAPAERTAPGRRPSPFQAAATRSRRWRPCWTPRPRSCCGRRPLSSASTHRPPSGTRSPRWRRAGYSRRPSGRSRRRAPPPPPAPPLPQRARPRNLPRRRERPLPRGGTLSASSTFGTSS